MNVEPRDFAAAPQPRLLAASAALTFAGAALGLVASSRRSATLMLAGIALYVLGVLGRYLTGRRIRVVRLPHPQHPQHPPRPEPERLRRQQAPGGPASAPPGLTVEGIHRALDGPDPEGGSRPRP